MARPAIVLRLDRETVAGHRQRLAGEEIWSDRPLVAGARPAAPPEESGPPFDEAGATLLFAGLAADGGALRRVVARIDRTGTRAVDYEDGERFRIAAGGGAITRERTPEREHPALTLERALGAPLALALAAGGVHLLHACAIELGRGAVALTADSGVGKSTFAAAAGLAGVRRLADDLLPVRLTPTPVALPRFPQLKLPAEDQYPAAGPETLPLVAVVELVREGAGGPVAVERLGPPAATLLLAGATVAARLFDPELLAAHFAACAASAPALVALRLRYPTGPERLPECLERLREVVESSSRTTSRSRTVV